MSEGDWNRANAARARESSVVQAAQTPAVARNDPDAEEEDDEKTAVKPSLSAQKAQLSAEEKKRQERMKKVNQAKRALQEQHKRSLNPFAALRRHFFPVPPRGSSSRQNVA